MSRQEIEALDDALDEWRKLLLVRDLNKCPYGDRSSFYAHFFVRHIKAARLPLDKLEAFGL